MTQNFDAASPARGALGLRPACVNHDLHVAGPQILTAMEKLGWTTLAGRVVTKDVRGHMRLLAGTGRWRWPVPVVLRAG